jgi:hypothetical protein
MFIPKLDQKGLLNPLTVPVIFLALLFIGTSVTSVMYYSKFIEQRDENKPIIAAAVKEATAAQKKKLDSEFDEREKVPTKQYISPSEFGSVKLVFPKTWSGYVNLKASNGMEYLGHPNFVPADNVNYALKMEVVQQPFANEIVQYDELVKKGDLRATAVQASGATGTRLDGLLQEDQEGSMVVFPLRDKTLKISTQSKEFEDDFNNIVLQRLTFVP